MHVHYTREQEERASEQASSLVWSHCDSLHSTIDLMCCCTTYIRRFLGDRLNGTARAKKNVNALQHHMCSRMSLFGAHSVRRKANVNVQHPFLGGLWFVREFVN